MPAVKIVNENIEIRILEKDEVRQESFDRFYHKLKRLIGKFGQFYKRNEKQIRMLS